jgi:hypothetical protein
MLKECLEENKYGITSNKLYEALSKKLNAKFEFSLFNCQTFNEYLTKNAEPFADIMIKMNTLILYPKSLNAFSATTP